MKDIVVRGAREHNLKNINVTLPRDKFIVITGLSGSGKSTLAFDTIYAEGQRRYVESLSSYARQFLGVMDKPDVDSIDGLSPAISIEQKTTSKNPRSTVGTVTEVYDYLRLLYARIGTPHCTECNQPLTNQTIDQILDKILVQFVGKKIQVLSPVIRKKKGTYEKIGQDFKKQGFVRMRVNGELKEVDEKLELDRYKQHTIEVVVDRLVANVESKSRLFESIQTATSLSKGLVVLLVEEGSEWKEHLFTTSATCPEHGISFEELEPRIFSFNSPFGACEGCSGLGIKQDFDPDLIAPDKSLSIIEGALTIYGKIDLTWRSQQLAIVGKSHGFKLDTPLSKFSEAQFKVLMYGDPKPLYGRWSNGASMSMEQGWEGIIPQAERLYKQTESEARREELQKFIRESECPTCKGKRLKQKVLFVRVAGKSIDQITDMSIVDAQAFFLSISLSSKEMEIGKLVIKEINSRLKFLVDVGLGYITLSRNAGTLSGGESQRIRLATQIGANLMGVLYVLDEPSIGLHQRDNEKLINTLHHLRDLGNTLLVVEHDEDTMKAADWIVDMGPGAGIHGGNIVAEGTPKEIMLNKESLTGLYLSGKESIPTPKERKKPATWITIEGAREHNLQNLTVQLPTEVLCCITGVSGSGKSTLIHDILYAQLMRTIHKSPVYVGKHTKLFSYGPIDAIINIDQEPIGRTPRSNPATYTKVFDPIRDLFASVPEAKAKGFDVGRFSFNVVGGRCENCKGDGQIKIEMNFLPDVYVTCEVCKGKRYNSETLTIKYKEKTIADVLDMSVDEAVEFFQNFPMVFRKLKTLQDVGLGYIKLGQSSVTLSGGEAQRIKITRELSKSSKGHTVYILDEPTTGLHFADVKKLITVLNRLVEKRNSVYVIEHNLDVIKCADYIVDLGPEGGSGGGQIVAVGTPEEVVQNKKSYTGQFLKEVLRK